MGIECLMRVALREEMSRGWLQAHPTSSSSLWTIDWITHSTDTSGMSSSATFWSCKAHPPIRDAFTPLLLQSLGLDDKRTQQHRWSTPERPQSVSAHEQIYGKFPTSSVYILCTTLAPPNFRTFIQFFCGPGSDGGGGGGAD